MAAAEILVKEGFVVLPYINADPVLAKRLQDVGTATVMPLGSPIGSNRGIETRAQIEIIIEQATVPVVVDAGLGAPSQAAEAMEMGADAVLVNTAIAIASDPSRMAHAFRKAVEAGREAREIGLAERRSSASATSPLTGFFSSGAEHVSGLAVPRQSGRHIGPAPRHSRLQRPISDTGVVIELDLPAAYAAHKTPAMLQDEIAQLGIRKRLDDLQLGRMRDEVFGLHREHSRDLRDYRR